MTTRQRREDEKFCSDCGAVISAKAETCPKCHVRQMNTNVLGVAPNGRSRVLAALLAICLGGIGIHKFYLGKIFWGILYLLLCWTFVPAVIGIIEGIILITMSDETFVMKYGQINEFRIE